MFLYICIALGCLLVMINTCAGIDLGSNAIRLLIKKIDSKVPFTLREGVDSAYYRVPVRVGVDVFNDGVISESKANELAVALRNFHKLMLVSGVERYRACATAAFREARNGRAVLDMAEKVSGLRAEIVSGEEEARLMRCGFVPKAGEEWHKLVFVDVGGGSTELSVVIDGKLVFIHSFDIGSMRHLSQNEADTVYDVMRSATDDIYKRYGKMPVVSTGGNIHMANKLLYGKKASEVISIRDLRKIYDDMGKMTAEEIAEKYRIDIDRAEVIVPATFIYLILAKSLHADSLQTPPVSLRCGIVKELADAMKDGTQRTLPGYLLT